MSYTLQCVVTWVIRSLLITFVLSMTACTITGSGSLTKDGEVNPSPPRSIGP